MFSRCVGILLAMSLFGGSTTAARQTAAVSAAELMRDVQVLAADDMEGRLPETPGSARARGYIIRRFKESGIRPLGRSFEQPFTFASRTGQSTKGVNVIGVIRGVKSPDRYLVITAHYDHLGVRNRQIFNGADDNASGVAGLFALGRHFSKHPPQQSLIFAALDAEENGLHGAEALLKAEPVPIQSIAVNVNLDMIGREPSRVLYAVGTHHYPSLKRHLEGVAEPPVELRLGHDVPNGTLDDWTRDSDHYVFHQRQIPFLYFGVEDVAQHHKPTDDAETIEEAFLAAAVRTIISVVARLDAAGGRAP